MSNAALNAYIDNVDVIKRTVFFEGSTALVKGQGLCYNFDYGTAATAEPARSVRCELPSITNARHFAGVVLNPRAAKVGGQWVDIAVPGSTCYVLMLGPSVTPGAGIVTCQAGGTYAGYFTRAGFQGEGSAVPLQTVNASAAAALCLVKLQIGLPSGLVEVVTPPAAGGATTFMVGGVSFVAAQTLGADATFTLADGLVSGLRKKFYMEGAQTTNNLVITVTHGLEADMTALASYTMDDIADVAVVEWNDGVWVECYSTGAVKG